MTNRNLRRLCLAGVLAGAMGAAQAVTISASPSSQTVALGDPASLSITLDFTDNPTLGGGFDVFYDSVMLDFVSFVFDLGFVGDLPFLRRSGDDLPGEVNGIAFIMADGFTGFSGPAVLGTLTFDTVGVGTSQVTMADNDVPPGPFIPIVGGGPGPIAVDYVGAFVSVPEPATSWLLLGPSVS